MTRPRIAVTCGDPCGVGPEVILKALAQLPAECRNAQLIVIGPPAVFAQTARRLRVRAPRWRVVDPTARLPREPRVLLIPLTSRGPFVPGRTGRRAGEAALAALEQAVRLWRRGAVQALVTAPVTKWSVALAAPGFIGHTEWLAARARAPHVVMTFVSPSLRVALLTRHLPLVKVAQAVSSRELSLTVRALDRALQGFDGIRTPRIAVCGINPHAGEAGTLGNEEQRVMTPVIRALRRSGVRCEGPLAADGVFADASRFDAIVCAYHDQGLIPFKMASRDQGCQVTLGLPFVRTSPDHGSALDIAGRGVAHPGSMRYALATAVKLLRAS